MHVLVTGSSGLIGSALTAALRKSAHSATCLLRPSTKVSDDFKFGKVAWDPDKNYIDWESIHRVDAVVHLAGENIARRWTPEQKAKVRDSRVAGTRLLCETIVKLPQPPRVLVAASAIGYYGNRGDEILTEASPPGAGFLADTCRAWEAATEPAEKKGIRVVYLRIGVVLSPAGGALAKMLTPFKLGLGGKIGSGNQFMSWIAIDDVAGVILHALSSDGLRGAVNAVAPNAVTNLEFTKILGRVLSRPTIFPMPAFAARAAFGEMADELLLASTRVQPARLLAGGYTFLYPQLEGALRHLLA